MIDGRVEKPAQTGSEDRKTESDNPHESDIDKVPTLTHHTSLESKNDAKLLASRHVKSVGAREFLEQKDSNGLRWIEAICLVTFDLDEGQIIESMSPKNAFDAQSQKLLALLSSPDSNSFGSEGNCKYIFTFRPGMQLSDFCTHHLFIRGKFGAVLLFILPSEERPFNLTWVLPEVLGHSH